jgi:hypothetical protein
MRHSQLLWTLIVLALEATVSSTLSIELRAVAPGTAAPVSPYADNFTVLASGVKIYGIPSLGPLSLEVAEDADQVHKPRRDLLASDPRDNIAGGDGRSSSSSSSRSRSTTTAADAATRRGATGWCNASSIDNQGSDNSPLISDCQAIAAQVYELADADNAYFGRSECNPDTTGQFTCYFPVVSFQTCMFGVSTIDTGINVSVRVGWQDVGDLITDSISQCGNQPSSGKVGTAGEMMCPEEISAIASFSTAWGLYHA